MAFATSAPDNYVDPEISPLLTSILYDNSGGHHFCLQTVPILTGYLTSEEQETLKHVPLYNHSITVCASEAISFSFAIYGFNSGHFISHHDLPPFEVVLAADIHQCGRALFKQFTRCPTISNSADDLLGRISSSTATTTIHGYCIHSHRFGRRETKQAFWTVQAAIVRALRAKRGLTALWVYIHPSCDMKLALGFRRAIQRTGWILSTLDAYFPDIGDSIADSATFFVGVHKGSTSNHLQIRVPFPPPKEPQALASFVYPPFNKREHAVSFSRFHQDFPASGCTSSDPPPEATSSHRSRAKCIYNIHRSGDNPHISAGAGVYDTSGLCPPFGTPNPNIFSANFGIEYDDGATTFVRPISPYEVSCCFCLNNDLTYALSHPANFGLLDCGIPSRTSRLFLSAILYRLESIRTENFEVHDPSLAHAPAAITMIPAFTNGAIGSRIPDSTVWIKALHDDPMTNLLLQIVANPGLAEDPANIKQLHSVYRHPARQGHFCVKDGLLYMKEIFQHDIKYVHLRIVPASLQNIIFVAFHANPIGGHLDSFRTFHRIRQRYFWPGMYQYCKRLIKACPGCSLSNITQSRSSDLVYSFPIEAPMRVLFLDVYAAGVEFNFDGTKHYLIGACGMCSFAICEATPEQTATAFASALMKIWLRFGFSHTIVVDKASAFLGVFAETAALLNINIHVLSGENHDPMIVEQICRFLNSCLTDFCNERGTNRVAFEGILMSLYAWNSAPSVGTDISRSLLTVGREFNFPIDFSADKHQILTSNPSRVASFASEQATMLSCGRAIARELIHHHRAYHREYINARRPNQRLFAVGDYVFAKRSVKSDRKRGLVGKLMEPYTGPWRITKKLAGSSYELEHRDTKRPGKRHAAHLSPYPRELLPFLPLDGPDNRYGQMYSPIQSNPYKNAGIRGFTPSQPFKTASIGLSSADDNIGTRFPTLAELNAELFDWDEGEEEAVMADDSLISDIEIFSATPAPIPPTPAPASPSVPDLGPLTANIMASDDKLFFISHRIPGSTVSEWALVRVDVQNSLKAHPTAFQDGRFLVDFYTCHPADTYYNAINQRYWLEYHPILDTTNPSRNKHTHLIRPSAASPTYATAEGLRPFRQWVRLTNSDTYITGPFDFAVINNRKSRDRISRKHWTTLAGFKHLFSNNIPSLELPEYSVHFGQFHSSYESKPHDTHICAFLASPSSPSTV